MATLEELKAALAAKQKGGTTLDDLKAVQAARMSSEEGVADLYNQVEQRMPAGPGAPIATVPPAMQYTAQNRYNPSGSYDAAGTLPWPAPKEPGFFDGAGRGLQLGVQSAGAALADVLGTPVDIATLATNAGIAVPNMLGAGIPYVQPGFFKGGSQSIKDTAADVTNALGGNVIPWEERTSGEKLRGLMGEFAGAAGLGSSLSRVAAGAPQIVDNLTPGVQGAVRTLTAPYAAEGSAGRVFAGDIAAGAGSGAGLHAYDENVPDEYKGPVGALLSMMAGGVAGNKLANIGEGLGRMGSNMMAKATKVPAETLGLRQETQVPFTARDASTAKAMLESSFARDPAQTWKNIDTSVNEMGGGPLPTTALMGDDPGLIALEKQARAKGMGPEFMSADQNVRDFVSQTAKGIIPEGANPEAPRPVAGQINAARMQGAQDQAAQSQAALSAAEQQAAELAAALSSGRSLDTASRDLDRAIVEGAYLPDRATKNALYTDAGSDPNVVVRTDNARARADEMLARNMGLNPALRDAESMKIADAFGRPRPGPTVEAAGGLPSTGVGPQEPPVTRTLGEVLADRMRLSEIEREARARGEFTRADTARGIKTGLNEDVSTAARSGVPGTEKLAAADKFYKEEFAPAYREGLVAPDFFRKVDQDPRRMATPPERTAGTFLKAGPDSRAAAADLKRILDRTPDPAEAAGAATDYVVADAVKSGVVKGGRISPTDVKAFMDAREGMFSQVPEIKARFDEIARGATESGEMVARLKAAADEASANVKTTEKAVNSGILKTIETHEPRKAAAAIFAAPDSVASMREAVSAFKGNKDAAEGLKAAVGEYMYDKITVASKAGVSSGESNVSLASASRFFEQNRKALAELYSPEEMNALQQVQKRMEALSRRATQATAGSPTAETLMQSLVGIAGDVTMFARGALVAGSVERRLNRALSMFPDSQAAAKELLERALIDPKVALALRQFPTEDAQVYTWSRKMQRYLNLAHAGAGAGQGEEEE